MDQAVDFIRDVIAENLTRIRKEKALSLDQVAQQSGVSKSMIHQIESGASSPTIATLWRIALGLQIPFTALIEKTIPESVVIHKDDLPALNNGDEHYHLYAFFPVTEGRDFEVLFLDMEPGAISESEPHAPGTTEYIIATGGVMEVRVGERTYQVGPDGGIFFAADKPHAYCNRSDKPVKATMVIHYGKR